MPRLIGASIALLALFVLAVLLWRRADRVHTHFTVIDPTSNRSEESSVSIEFPDNQSESNYFTVGNHFTKHVQSVPDVVPLEEVGRAIQEVAVIYLRPTSARIHGLDPFRSDEAIQDLKTQLSEFEQDHLKLVFIDYNSVESDWRWGFFGESPREDEFSWAAEIPNTIVVVSTRATEKSWPASLPDWGGTIFERIVEQAFSSAADSNQDRQLTVNEVLDFITTQTNSLVSTRRDFTGQTVQIFPPIDSLDSGEESQETPLGELVVLKSPPPPIPREASPSDLQQISKVQQQIAELWDRLNKVSSQRLVDPIRWQSTIAQIRQAQTYLQTGHVNDLQEKFDRIIDSLQALETNATSNPSLKLQLPRQDLLSESSTVDDWSSIWAFTELTDLNATEIAAEAILKKTLEQYPFQATSTIGPTASEQQQIVDARRQIEQVAALTFGCQEDLSNLVLSVQQMLLESEDLIFLNEKSGSPTRSTRTAIRDRALLLNRQIEDYVRWSVRASKLEREVLNEVDNYAHWAATAPGTQPANQARLIAAILDRDGTATLEAPNDTERFQAACVQLFTRLETLLTLHLQLTSAPFADLQELSNAAQKLQTAYEDLHNAREAVETMSKGLLNQPAPGSSVEKWQQARSLRWAPVLESSLRTKIFEMGFDPISEVNDTDELEADKPGDNSGALAQWKKDVLWESVWALRIHDCLATVLPDEDESETEQDTVRTAWIALQNEDSPIAIPRRLDDLSSAVIDHWAECREFVRIAHSRSSETMDQYSLKLLKADLASRFLSDSDYDLIDLHRQITQQLAIVSGLRTALLQADRAILSQWILQDSLGKEWIDPSRVTIRDQDKWFHRVTQFWIEEAERLLKQGGMQDENAIVQERSDRLKACHGWSLTENLPELGSMRFPYQQNEITATWNITVDNPPPDLGTMAINLVTAQTADGADIEVIPSQVALDLKSPEVSSPIEIRRQQQEAGDDCQPLRYLTGVFYRGTAFRTPSLTIDPCPARETHQEFIAQLAPPTLRVTGEDVRPVMFVLDWSFSMQEKDRDVAALNALQGIITQSQATGGQIISDQAKVGLVIYGHRIGAQGVNESYVNFAARFRNQTVEDVSQALSRVRDPLDDARAELAPRRLEVGRDDFLQVIRQFRDIPPFGSTPLGQGIVEAAKELEELGDEGGLVCVITDGAPRDLGKVENILSASQLNSWTPRQVRDLQNKLDDRAASVRNYLSNDHISAVILALDFQEGAEEFQTLESIFGPDGLNVRIENVSSQADPRVRQLQEVIASELKPRQFTVETSQGVAIGSFELGETVRNLEIDKEYVVKFGQFEPQRFRVSPGDQLEFSLNWETQKLDVERDFDRSSRSPSIALDRNLPRTLPTILRADASMLGTPSNGEVRCEIQIMLDHAERERVVQRPEEIEFEFQAIGQNGYIPDRVRIESNSQFGAPGWTALLDPWPSNRGIDIHSWWKMTRTPPDQILSLSSLSQASSANQTVVIGDGAVPECRFWNAYTVQDGRQIYEVHLEPVDASQFEAVKDLRIEIGSARILNDRNSFVHERVDHEVTIVESGIVVHSFLYPRNASPQFDEKVLAITTAESRREDAFSATVKVTRLH
ncbi:hypothetical protein [Thalassoglobus neptunius]|nr:hypothetical protein [Thalassoglobus neptunius]